MAASSMEDQWHRLTADQRCSIISWDISIGLNLVYLSLSPSLRELCKSHSHLSLEGFPDFISVSSHSQWMPRFYLIIISFSVEAQILSHYHLILRKCPNLISVSSHSQLMPRFYLTIISLSWDEIVSWYNPISKVSSWDNPSHETIHLRRLIETGEEPFMQNMW